MAIDFFNWLPSIVLQLSFLKDDIVNHFSALEKFLIVFLVRKFIH